MHIKLNKTKLWLIYLCIVLHITRSTTYLHAYQAPNDKVNIRPTLRLKANTEMQNNRRISMKRDSCFCCVTDKILAMEVYLFS